MRTNPSSRLLRYRLFALLVAGCGLAVSALADTVPSVTSALQSQTVTGGASVSFTVTASGTTPLYYQWLFNGANLAGANGTTLTLTNVQLPNAGSYSIIVTNAAGGVTNLVAVLGVTNGQVAVNVALGKPVTPNGSFGGTSASLSNTVTDGVFLGSGTQWQSGTVWWNGTAPAVEVDLQGSFLINGVVVQADDNDSYLLEFKTNAAAPWVLMYQLPYASGGGMRTRPNMGNNAERYVLSTPLPASYLRLRAYAGDNSYSVCEIQAYTTYLQPLLTQQPASLAVMAGDPAQFTVAATGSGSLAYQWQCNGTNLLNATNAALSFPSAAVPNAGAYRVIVTNTVGTATSLVATLTVTVPACVAPPSGLVGWWKAEGNADDLVGTNNGTMMNGASFAPGRAGTAFSFDGIDDFVSIGSAPGLMADELTIEAWVKPILAVQSSPFQVWIAGRSGDAQVVLRPGVSGYKAVAQIRGSDNGFREAISTDEIPVGSMTHVAGTWSGSTLRIYINGHLSGETIPGITRQRDGCGFFIGGVMENNGGLCVYTGQFFTGLIDEVAVFNRALTSIEVAAIYAAGSTGMCNDLESIRLRGLVSVRDATNLVELDPATGAVGRTRTITGLPTGWEAFSLAYHKLERQLYGLYANPQSSGHELYLVRLDPATGGATVVADLGYSGSVGYYESLEYVDSLGQIVSSRASSLGNVWQTDLLGRMATNGQFTTLCNNGRDNDYAVYDSRRNIFYTTDPNGVSRFTRVNLGTGSVTDLSGDLRTNLGDPAYDPDTDAFYAVDTGVLYRWQTDGTTGVTLTAVGTIPGSSSAAWGGLAFVADAPQAMPAPSGLVAWWKGDGNALDSIGTNHGTLIGASYAAGLDGQAFNLDGTSGYMQVAAPTGLPTGSQPRTLALWFKTPRDLSVSTESALVQYGSGSGSQMFGLITSLNAPGKLYFWGNSDDLAGTTTLQPNVWYYGVVTYDGSIVRLYLNGQLEATKTSSLNTVLDSNGLLIGNRPGVAKWQGQLDEVTLFNRALSSNEIAALYAAGGAGIYLAAPVITQHPTSTNFFTGGTAVFNVTAASALSLGYAWQLNGTNLPGAIAATLALSNAQPSQSGDYRVIVTNTVGAVTSLVATLTVSNPPCFPMPIGVLGWWKGDGDFSDVMGQHAGVAVDTVTFEPGLVGQAFRLVNSVVRVPGTFSFAASNAVTLQAWFRFDVHSGYSGITSAGDGTCSYRLMVSPGSRLFYNPGTHTDIEVGPTLTLGTWYHAAMTVEGGRTARIYLNGQLISESSSGVPGVLPSLNDLLIGAGENTSIYRVESGLIDEIGIVGRALSSNEIAALYLAGSVGMCNAVAFVAQPQSQTNFLGGTATFTATASGPGTLSYQWRKNGLNLAGANGASLVLTNLQTTDIGSYDLVAGSGSLFATSQVALLMVNYRFVAVDDFSMDHGNPNGLWSYGWMPNDFSVFNLYVNSGTGNAGSPMWFGWGGDRTPGAWKNLGSPVNGVPTGWLCLHPGNGNQPSVLRWTAPADGVVEVAGQFLPGDLGYMQVAVRRNGQAWWEAGDFGSFDLTNTVSVGSTIDFAVYGAYYYGSTPLAATITYLSNSLLPIIVSQPLSRANAVGTVAEFAVSTIGPMPLNYQWCLNNAPLAGANGTNLVFTSVDLTNAGSYSVVVTNNYGAVTSLVVTLTVTNPVCSTPLDGMIAWWKAENNATDFIGGHNGTLSSGVSFGAGRAGRAFVFDGTSGYVEIPHQASLDPGTNSFTVEAWIQTTNQSGTILSKYECGGNCPSGNADSVYLLGMNSGVPYAWIRNHSTDGSVANGVGSSSSVADGLWHHVVVVRDQAAGMLLFYVDGTLAGSVATVGATSGSLTNDDGEPDPLVIGAHVAAGQYTKTDFFHGKIDEVSLYLRALSPAEIAAVYNAGIAGKCAPTPCFYSTITSTFDSDADGWQTISLASLTSISYGPVTSEFISSGGNPGGQIHITDPDGNTFYFQAPARYLGDQTAAYGQVFSFDLRHSGSGTTFDGWGDVILEGASTRLVANFSGQANSPWRRYQIQLSEAGAWKSGDLSGPTPTADQFLSVLRNLVAVRIRGEFISGSDEAWLDNVSWGGCASPATIITQPQSATVLWGGTTSFVVVASSPVAMTYQWRFNGAPLSGGTSDTLALASIQPAQAGSYDVVVSNLSGSVTSTVAVLTVITNIPDLLVTDLAAASTAQAGQPVAISWTVTNAGNALASGPWQEALLLANNPAMTGAATLYTYNSAGSLANGLAATRSQTMILAGGLSGNYWLAVRVDSANQVAESYGETNNLSAPQSILITSPDLGVSQIASAGTALFGQPFAVTWVATNFGNGPTLGAWSDHVWLSSASNSLSGATTLAFAANVGALPALGSYANTVTVTIPLTAQSQPGTVWLVVQVDSAGAVSESNEGNNLLSAPLTLALPPLPDLSAVNVSAPASAASGDSVQVVWAVTNLGPAGVTNATWAEAVYLVPDDTTDWTNPINLATRSPIKSLLVTNTLSAGDFLLRTQTVTVPLASPVGATRFVVLVDSANQVVEANEANNIALATNTTAIPAVLTLQLPVSQLSEGAAAVQATLTCNGAVDLPLSVTVTNDRPGEISFSLGSAVSSLTVTIPAGSASAQFDVRALTDGVVDGPQTVTIAAAAPGFPTTAATLIVLDVDVPRLWLSINPSALIEGGSVTGTVTRELVTGSALVVPLAGSGSSRLIVPASVTILAGAASADFTVSAGENFVVEGPRACTVFAQATGYQSASAPLTLLDNDMPVVTLTFTRTNLSEGDGAQAAQVTVTRAPVTTETVYLELANDNPSAALVPQFVSVPAGQSAGHFYVAAINNDVTNAPQTAVLTPYILDSVTGARLWTNPPITLTINDDDGPALRVTIPRKAAPEGSTNVATIWRNTGTNGALVVSLASSDLTEATVPATVTIPDGQSSVSVTIQTLSDGIVDGNQSVTISASAAGYAGSSDFFVVSDMTLPDLTVALTTVPASADSESYVQVGYHIANEGVAPASGNWTVKLFLARNPAVTYDVLLDTYTFPGALPFAAPMNFFERTLSVLMPRDTGNWYVVAVVDADSVVTELLEDNNVAISAQPIQVRAAYTAAVTVVPPKTLLAGTPVTLTGQAVLRDGVTPAGNVLVNIHVMRGDTNGLRRVISALTAPNGTFGTQLQPLPGEAGLYVVGAAHPGETTAPAQDSFRWLAMQAQPPGLALRLTEGGSTGGTITLVNLSGVPLTGLSASVVGASANLVLTPTLSDATLPASNSVSVGYAVAALNASVHQASATLHFASAEGVTADVPFYVIVDALVPQLAVTPSELVRGVLRGQQALVEFDVVNNGGTNTGPITVSLPGLSWLSLVTANPLPALPPNGAGTNHVTLLLSPPMDVLLTEFSGTLALNCANGGAGLAVPYRFRTLSDSRAPVLVYAEDEYTFYAEGSPRLADANVTLADAVSGATVTNGVTDTNGVFDAGLLPEGYYTLTATATNHTDDREIVLIVAGRTNEIHAFLSRQAVHYVWTVEPTEIEDRTRITIETVFETKVPMPVITVVPALIDMAGFGPAQQIDMMVTNAGLVAGFNTTLSFDDHPLWQVTPLIGSLGTVAANSGVVVPVQITRKPGATPDCHTPCTFYGRASWTLVSAGKTYGYTAPITFINAWTNCVCSGTPGTPTPPTPGPGPWYGTNYYPGPGNPGPVIPTPNPPPTFTSPPRCVPHLDGVCAKVKLQLNQDAVLSRDAFKATLEIENATAGNLSNVLVQLDIRDASGMIVPTNLFGVADPILTGLTGVDGAGVVNAQVTGKAEWIIVPSVDAAPETNLNYTVGGTLTYLDNGSTVTVPLVATRITVHPLPQLKLDYFHQRDVFSDDPWTSVVEPKVPYSLAVMIQNTGRGVASHMRIASAQPQIVENESGLLIDFTIISTEVAGQNMTPSLTADFGDIAPGQIKIGRWLMTSTLHGQFTSYEASFQHLDGMGNTRLAIITNVAIHEMTHLVQAPGKYEDGMPDFLVNEINLASDPIDLPDTVYLSDGTKAPVTVVQTASVVGTLGPANHSVVLNAPLPAGFVYLRIPDPGHGLYQITKVVRSDGREIYFGTNVWTTDRTFGDPHERPTYENILHLFDAESTGSYTLYYSPVPTADVLAPVSHILPLPPVSFPTIPLHWTGADELGGSGLAFFNIFVSDNGGPFAPWLLHTPQQSALFGGAPGHTYAFYSVATDAAGNAEPAPIAPQAQTLTSLTNSPPVFAALAPQVINEGATLLVDLPVTDPENDTLTFAFLGTPPSGMTLDTALGRLTWPTGEATGPSTNVITIVVTDNGSPSLSATGLVTVVVNEVNQAPTLAPIASRAINPDMTLLLTNSAADLDLPANTLTFTLGPGAPLGATLSPLGGVFAWHPTTAQSPSTNPIAVIVTDNGVPALSATQTFTVIVTNANHPPTATNYVAGTLRNTATTLALAKLLKFAGDPDHDTLTVSAAGPTSAHDGRITLGGTTLTYLPPTNYSGADSFPYTVSDGHGGTATAQILVTVREFDSSANKLGLTAIPGGWRLTFAGVSGRTYRVQRSAIATGGWGTAATLVMPAAGVTSFDDLNPPVGTGFYRAVAP